MPSKKGGRPTVFTEEALQKLEQAFRMGANVEIACIGADISERAYYYRLKKDKGFLQRMKRAQNFAIMILHQKVYQAVESGDARLAWDVLKAKCPDKYGRNVVPRTVTQEFEDELGLQRGWFAAKERSAR